jgi:[protein-PII] uridylyltransferase
MMACGVRVHDARIATFGERVEDFFQLTDRSNAPLSETQQQRLWQALAERIGPTKG